MCAWTSRLWRVLEGSGVGLKHSPYIADLTFATLGDEWACRPETRNAFGILCIKRFRDHLFVVSDRPENMYWFFKWRRHSIIVAFKLEIPEVSSLRFIMLPVEISIEQGRFVCRPRQRAQRVPRGTVPTRRRSIDGGRWAIV